MTYQIFQLARQCFVLLPELRDDPDNYLVIQYRIMHKGNSTRQ